MTNKQGLISNIFLWGLLSISFVYGIFSSPAPTNLGLAEFFIAFVLIILVVLNAIYFLHIKTMTFPWAPLYCLGYLAIIPTFVGAENFNKQLDLLRDVIPVAYIFSPLLFYPLIKKIPTRISEQLICSLLVIGLIYACRYLYYRYAGVGFYNLQLDPAVTFTCFFSTLMTFRMSLFEKRFHSYYFILSLVTFLSLFKSNVRLQLVLVLMITCSCVISFICSNFARKRYLLSLVGGVVLFSIPILLGMVVFPGIVEKTAQAGLLNNRGFELSEVMGVVTSDSYSILFGKGWGSKVFTSTTGGEVRYTHSFFLWILWKAGMFGLLMIFGYFYFIYTKSKNYLFNSFVRKLPVDELIIVVSITLTFLVHLFFEAGYKTLTFGMLLMLLISKSLKSLYCIR